LGIVLGYMGLLYFGAVIVPGVGLSGQLLSQVPGNFLDWAHAPGYGILALLLARGLQRRAWPLAYALPVAAAAALVFGLWTEVFQGSVQGRGASADDLVTDAIGIGVASILMLSETVRNRIVLRPCLDSFLSFWRAGFLVSLARRVKLTRQIR
jgi:VanZ family protein